jgi:NhaP-type Na+/H+ or K+/H+ antiporter
VKNYILSGYIFLATATLIKCLFVWDHHDFKTWEWLVGSVISSLGIGGPIGAVIGAVTGWFLLREERNRRAAEQRSRTDLPYRQ